MTVHYLFLSATKKMNRKVGEVEMKRLWPEEDAFFWIGVALAAFFTFCISALYALGGA